MPKVKWAKEMSKGIKRFNIHFFRFLNIWWPPHLLDVYYVPGSLLSEFHYMLLKVLRSRNYYQSRPSGKVYKMQRPYWSDNLGKLKVMFSIHVNAD